MTHVISITSPVSSAGKTITAINLAAALAVYEKTTLLIDCDPQNRCIYGTLVEPPLFDSTLDSVLKDEARINDAIAATPLPKLKCIPAGKDLAATEQIVASSSGGLQQLAEKLKTVSDDFDFIVIDTPSGMGPFSQMAVAASDQLLIPLHLESLESDQKTETIERINHFLSGIEAVDNKSYGSQLRKNMLITKSGEGQVVSLSTAGLSSDHGLFPAIPHDMNLHHAYVFGKPVVLHDIASPGAAAYLVLAKELIQQVQADLDLLMNAAKEPAVKLIDDEIIYEAEKQFIGTLIYRLDRAALKSAVIKKFNLDSDTKIVFKSGEIIIYDDEIACRIGFNDGFSVVIDRSGEMLALSAPSKGNEDDADIAIAAKSGSHPEDKKQLKEKAAQMAVELADMISEINR